MREIAIFLSILGALLSLILVAGGALVWLAPVEEQLLTPAQKIMLNTADWMIKSSAGAIFGLAAGRRLVSHKPQAP